MCKIMSYLYMYDVRQIMIFICGLVISSKSLRIIRQKSLLTSTNLCMHYNPPDHVIVERKAINLVSIILNSKYKPSCVGT